MDMSYVFSLFTHIKSIFIYCMGKHAQWMDQALAVIAIIAK